MADYGKRKCKHCSEEFNKRSPLDMFCSQKCGWRYNRKKKDKKAPRKPIKKFSDKRAKRNVAYLLARDVFLQEDKNKFCPVMSKLYNKTVPTSEIHHTNSKENERLNDREYWLAVSREGHQYIHSNPEIAYEEGWLTKDYYKSEKN